MDYGPNLTHTYEVPGGAPNFAYKGIAVRLDAGAGGVSRGRHWMLYDADTLRVAAAWSASDSGDNFIDWRGIQLNGEHQIHPRVVGQIGCSNSNGPGWGDSKGSFRDDRRVEGRDGRRYGPLPREWAKYRGLYQHGQQVVVAYSVGSTDVLELPSVLDGEESPQGPLFLRTFNFGPRDRDLVPRHRGDIRCDEFIVGPAAVGRFFARGCCGDMGGGGRALAATNSGGEEAAPLYGLDCRRGAR